MENIEQFLQENYAKLSPNELTANTGLQWFQIKERVGRMRKNGIKVPYRRPHAHSVNVTVENAAYFFPTESLLTYNRQLLTKAIMEQRKNTLAIMLLAYNSLLLLSNKDTRNETTSP